MGVSSSGATLEIQLVADVARLQRDMDQMKRIVGDATSSTTRSFTTASAGTVAAATQMASAAQNTARAAMVGGAGIKSMGKASNITMLQTLELSHVARAFTDSVIAGQNPLRALAFELPRIGQAASYGTGGFRGLASAIASFTGIVRVSRDASLDAAAAVAQSNAAAIRSAAERASSALAARETQVALARAELEGAVTADAQAAAEAKLVRALRAAEVQAGKTTVAMQALATAEAEVAVASEIAQKAIRVSLGPVVGLLASLAVVAGLAYSAISQFQSQVKNSGELDRYRASLGLTRKEMLQLDEGTKKVGKSIKELAPVELTAGDVMHGLWQTLKEQAEQGAKDFEAFGSSVRQAMIDAAGGAGSPIDEMFKGIDAISSISGADVIEAWRKVSAAITAAFYGTYNFVIATWRQFPAALGDLFVQAVNLAIEAINDLVRASVNGVNWFIDHANATVGFKLVDNVAPPAGIAEVENRWKGAAANVGSQFGKAYSDAYDKARKEDQKFWNQVEKNSIDYRKKHMKEEADAIIANRTPKKAPGDHGLAQALAELDAQIRGQKALAEAYQVSDAAAMDADAHQKAEEEAIRHRGSVALFYEKEVQLAIAKTSADTAKNIANIRAETSAREKVNELIEQGLIPVAQLSQQLEFLGQKRQLRAAIELAQQHGLQSEVIRLTAEYKNLTLEQMKSADALAHTNALTLESNKDDEIRKLRLETSLIRASNRERAVQLAMMEAENEIRDKQIIGEDAAKVVKKYVDAANATIDADQAVTEYNHSLTETYDTLKLIAEQTQAVGQIMSDAFGSAGKAIGDVISSLTDWAAKQAQIDQEAEAARKKAGDNALELARINAEASKKSSNAQIEGIGSVLSAAKGLFKEHSTGYKAMEALEKAYAIASLARTIASIAPRIAAAAAQMFAELGPFGFAAVAAMLAVMAALGFSHGGGSSQPPPSAADLQAAAGTGTVLGDSKAQSDSIAHSLDIMSQNSTKGIDYSAQMTRSLRNIESEIGNLTSAIAKELQVGGAFDTSGVKLGTSSTASILNTILTPFLSVLGINLFGTTTKTKSLYDQGLQFNPTTLANAITEGITGSLYTIIQTVTKKSGFLGIGGSAKTSYSTTTSPLDEDFQRQVGLILASLRDSVVDAAKVLGLDVAAALDQFQVEIGKISFKDMTGDEIQKELEAVFSKIGDQMAGFAVQGLEQFQKAGEGLYETLMRIAKDYLTVDAALKSIGLTFGSVGVASVAARESLIELMGGLDQFVSQINYYYENFLTTAEQQTFLQGQVDAAFSQLGIAEPTTIDAFKALVSSLDLTTDAGQATFAALMAIAPAFYQVQTAAQQAADAAAAAAAALAKQKTELQIQLLQAQGNTVAATALQRQIELAAIDPSLQALQQQVWAAQDAAAAAAAAQELANKKTQIQIQLLEAEGKSEEALALQRKMELAALDPTLRALQQQVYAAEDVAKAKDNLLEAYKRESEQLQETADKFHKFADDLRAFKNSLFETSTGPTSYNTALINLMKESGLAVGGDETALGGGLQDAAQKFLDIATENAGSLADVARARALVARQLDQAISASDAKGTIADQQLAQMKDQVGKLVDINESVLSVADAIKALTDLLKPSTTGGGTTGTPPPHTRPPRTPGDRDHGTGPPTDHDRQVRETLDKLLIATETNVTATNRMARIFVRADRGSGIAIVTDKDAPIDVSGSDLLS
jgi:hypothetical protein